jgi:hypothetical protein
LGLASFEHPVLDVFGFVHGEGCPGAAIHALVAEDEIHVGWELAFSILSNKKEVTLVV